MAAPIVDSRHEVEFRPQYQLIRLQEADCLVEIPGAAITAAHRDIAAASEYVVVIVAEQDMVPVRVEVEVWSGPAPEGASPAWTGPLTFEIENATGQFLVGDGFGAGIAGVNPRQGPGRYAVEVYHAGRDEGRTAFREVLRALDDSAAVEEIGRRWSGVERYLIRLWYSGPGTPDEDDE